MESVVFRIKNFVVKNYGLFGVLSIILVYLGIFSSVALAPWFSWWENALSDLGAYPGTALIFNVSLIFAGFFMALFALGIHYEVDSKVWRSGAVIVFLAGISLALVGVFPETIKVPHFLAALMFFLLIGLGIAVMGLSIRHEDKGLGYFGVFAGAWVLFSWFVLKVIIGISGLAIPEIVSTIFTSLWIAIVSIQKIRGVFPP